MTILHRQSLSISLEDLSFDSLRFIKRSVEVDSTFDNYAIQRFSLSLPEKFEFGILSLENFDLNQQELVQTRRLFKFLKIIKDNCSNKFRFSKYFIFYKIRLA